jgi:7,8-dihydropterin-6-yl-methyl-4-(beta-D-ribofuranosyl)aminobenzene 5'-phosphate synthase
VLGNNYSMRFKVIIDDEKLKPEYTIGWGISVYFPDPMLLFDTGENYLSLEENLKISGIEKADIKNIFIPKETWEHTGGLEAIMDVNTTVYVPYGVSDDLIEMINSVGAECKMIEEIEEILPLFYSTGNLSGEEPEQALLVKGSDGVSIFVGSLNSNLIDIFKRVKSIDGSIDLLLGKLNTLSLNKNEIMNFAKSIGKYRPKRVAPTHCSGELALEVFKEYFKKRFINVGVGLEGDV